LNGGILTRSLSQRRQLQHSYCQTVEEILSKSARCDFFCKGAVGRSNDSYFLQRDGKVRSAALQMVLRIMEEHIRPGAQQPVLPPGSGPWRSSISLAPPSTSTHFHGVLAPNATLRSAVSVLIDDTGVRSQTDPDGAEQPDNTNRSPARYLWAMLLARIYEAFALACPLCGSTMTIITFITDPPVVPHILDDIGEPTTPPRVSPARGPPQWEEGAESSDKEPGFDPAPEYEYDQRITC
jgi:hypothetical protein